MFYASYAYMSIAEKLVWTKSKEPCKQVKIDFNFDSKLFKSELLSNFAVMKIFPQDPIDIFYKLRQIFYKLRRCNFYISSFDKSQTVNFWIHLL